MAKKLTYDAAEFALTRFRYDPETGAFFNIKSGKAAGNRQSLGYFVVYLNDKFGSVYAHRLAWFFMSGDIPPEEIDHINKDRGDNRACNLREATRTENVCNGPKRSHSKQPYKGVRLSPSGRWQARIRVGKKEISLGHFDSAREAYEEYIFAALHHHGSFASLV